MANVKSYTLTLDAQELHDLIEEAQELHDLIEEALVCECQNAEAARGLQRKLLETDAQKLICMNARLMRVVKRIQETEAKA